MTATRAKRTRRADPSPRPWQRFRQGLEQLLSSPGSPPPKPRSWNPDLRVIERRRELVIRFASRGIDPRKVRIQVSGNLMTLSGASVDFRPGQPGYHAFGRTLVLPPN